MSLDLNPEAETILRQEAEREGVSIDELIVRRFARPQPAPQEVPAPDAEKERVLALLRQWQKEYGMPPRPDGKEHTSVAELLAEWEAEDAKLTPEEVQAEQRFWEDYERERDQRPFQL